MLAGTVPGIRSLDSRGRRNLLIIATVVAAITLLLAGLSIQRAWSGLLTMAVFCIYGFVFQFWGLIAWSYPSEIFSMGERDRAVSLAVFMQYAANAGVVILTPHLMSSSVPNTLYCF